MSQRLKRYAVHTLGWFFIFLGILGLFLLLRESEWGAGKLDWLKTRYPRFGKTYDEADRRAMRL